LHRGCDERDDFVERRPLCALVRRRNCGHRIGMHERVGSVKGVEGCNKAIEGIALCRSRSRPRRQPHPVPEPAGEVEQVDCAVGSELCYSLLERAVEIDQIRSDVVAPEQRIG